MTEEKPMTTVTDALNPVQPRDRVVYADRWQGTLDTPSAEDLEWLAAHPSLPPIEAQEPDPEPFEPTDEDWDDYARWSGHITDEDIAAAGLSVG